MTTGYHRAGHVFDLFIGDSDAEKLKDDMTEWLETKTAGVNTLNEKWILVNDGKLTHRFMIWDKTLARQFKLRFGGGGS